MKKILSTYRGLIKGVPSAVLLSALLHLLLLVVASGFIVFNVIKKQETKFVPPAPVERPKMELKKPRVKVRKTAKPRATSRITANTTLAMPDIQLPDVTAADSGLSGGIGGFEMMPDPSEMTMFGGTKSIAIGNDFEGTFYSMEYDRRGKDLDSSNDDQLRAIRRFVESGWNPNAFAPYFRAPQKLYATQIMIPPISSEFGPSQFGMGFGPDFDPIHWCIHYKGKIAYKDGGKFRFRGMGDDILLVRINGKLVINAGWGGPTHEFQTVCDYRNSSEEDRKYLLGHSVMYVGEWFDLEPGVPLDMEVLIGEVPGGTYAAMLLIEQDGVKYRRNQYDAPMFPIFKTAEMPVKIRKQIQYTLIKDEVELLGGPTFNVY